MSQEVHVSIENFKLLSDGIADIGAKHKIPHQEFVGFLMELLCMLTDGKEIIYKQKDRTFVLSETGSQPPPVGEK